MEPTNEKVSNSIPDDLAFNILSKLPVKSLKRFRCVRKSWADLFENPHFMSMYRNKLVSKYDNDNSSLLLKQSMPNTHQDSLFLLSGERFENRVKFDWPLPFQENDINIFILGSSVNGTLCLYQDPLSGSPSHITQKVVLWNPATEEFKVIPSGTIECPLGVDILVELHGFGYDPVTDDYKLIRYFCFFKDSYWYQYVEDMPTVPEPLWQIYSQRSNSWRKLDVEMPSHAITPTGVAVYLNGVCHWRCHEELVSFNLSDEVFSITPLDSNDCYDLWLRDLVLLNESIAIITKYQDTTCFDISILGELGVKESWTKLFTIGPLPCVEHPIGVGKKGDIFFRKNDDELALFDLSTQMIEEIGIKGEAYCCHIVIYKESLLPIGRINN